MFISITVFIYLGLKMDELIKEFDIIKIPFAMEHIEQVNANDRIMQANARFNKHYHSLLLTSPTALKVRFTVWCNGAFWAINS